MAREGGNGRKRQHCSSSKFGIYKSSFDSQECCADRCYRFSGTEQIIQDSIRAAKEVAKSSGCQSFESATTQEAMESLWSARKQALWACLAVRPEGTEVWSTDVAVPISRMADLIGNKSQQHMRLSTS